MRSAQRLHPQGETRVSGEPSCALLFEGEVAENSLELLEQREQSKVRFQIAES